jgi:NADPH:quinone reductase-like Zn-dependent oxidoreductase
MKTLQLDDFGLDGLYLAESPEPGKPGPGEVLVRFEAACVNPRDLQIITGQFTPNVDFPLVPLSDGAGVVEAVGEGVTRVAVGDRITPTFFPGWISGEALQDERQVSSGLEAPGTAREYGIYAEDAVVRAAPHLTAAEAACYPCAGLTAWTALVEKSGIGEGDWVLIQGTGGVAMMALDFARALGANAIVLSSSDEKRAIARERGAAHTINYAEVPEWGPLAFEMSGHGVDAVVEIGGAGTMAQSLAAIRHGGHVNVIGYMAGFDLGVTVFPLIIRNANLHGIGTGNRDQYEAMMRFVAEHELHPLISAAFPLARTADALRALDENRPAGKIVIDISRP